MGLRGRGSAAPRGGGYLHDHRAMVTRSLRGEGRYVVRVEAAYLSDEICQKAISEILRAMAMKKIGLDDLSACETICLDLLQDEVMKKVPTSTAQ